MDWFCIDDSHLWVNLEQYVIKKERIFSGASLLKILQHFSNQGEGSKDFYDFIEHQYTSGNFKELSTKQIVSVAYSFYQVHAGTVHFFSGLEEDFNQRLNDTVSTMDLLRVLQSYSEISSQFPRLFVQLETLFVKRFD